MVIIKRVAAVAAATGPSDRMPDTCLAVLEADAEGAAGILPADRFVRIASLCRQDAGSTLSLGRDHSRLARVIEQPTRIHDRPHVAKRLERKDFSGPLVCDRA